jgi:hypothetical protein
VRTSRALRERDDASSAARFELPVSGLCVTLREPTGVEDVLIAEHRSGEPSLALELVQSLGHIDGGASATPQWSELAVADVDTTIVRLRQMLLGDRIVAEINCCAPACASRVDLSFGLNAYLEHNRAARRRARGRTWSVETCKDTPGWYVVRSRGVESARFRLPTLADQVAVYGMSDAEVTLASRCIVPSERLGTGEAAAMAKARAHAEAAMEAIAPPLAGPLQGNCPDCSTRIVVRFDARLYCLQELCDRARFVYDDVNTLAERYHWSEREILALTHARRSNYVERAHQTAVA